GPAVLPARVPMPPIYRRATWGADERKATWGPRYRPWIKAVAVHHTATTNSYSAGQVPAILRSILHFHAVSRGWGDIGYNVLVDRFGRVWEGRRGGLSTAVVGAHTGGFNSNTTGVAFIGDHRGTSVPRRAVEAAARYAAWKFSLAPAADPRGSTRLTGGGSSSRHPAGTTVTVPRIFPHGLTNRTSCPGARGLAVLPLLRQRVAALLGPWLNPAALRARLTVWRPSDATWRLRGTAAPLLRGAAGDVPAPADYDGDGRTDLATWRPDTGGWVIRYSASRTLRRLTWGNVAHVPVPADTDGNGRAEPLVFSRTSGNWYNAAAPTVNWGAVFGDVPLPADYDGDGREDLAVWRPSTGDWHIRGVGRFRLGDPSDVPVPADYDGDGDVEPAIWSPGSHRFTVRGQQSRQFGVDGDVPVPGQYDGDAPAELAVWRVVAGVGRFVVDGVGQYPFGTVGDQPIPAS
ncbi:MAG TPA: N-acetylmuramoyl-L-alanine amidase, partial [Pilimelia sp.]|nr:N-acetylmuramoyl-L-alanine amidase [Pilimelia sp.]